MGATCFQSLPNLNQQVTGPMVMPGAQEAGKAVQPSDIKIKDPPQQVKVANHSYEAIGLDVLKNMPSASTIGDGPNGRRIEGVLYQYLKGQVTIVCVCHDSFLTPAEFVKHAGGKEVDNPMRRISVSPTFWSPFSEAELKKRLIGQSIIQNYRIRPGWRRKSWEGLLSAWLLTIEESVYEFCQGKVDQFLGYTT